MIRIILLLLGLLLTVPAMATEAGWQLLGSGGHVVLLRHVYAPGSGDPGNFDIEKCGTQRNISSRGEHQAQRIGALFGARAAPTERVETSRYCRCRDTARIAFRGEEIVENEMLDLTPDEEVMAAQVEKLREEIQSYEGSGNLILVTHEEIIKALLGAGAHEGEAVIVSRGGDALGVAGRIRFN